MLHVSEVISVPQDIAWTLNYLHGRTQRALANHTHSDWTQITSGVPQGGVLSPYLFIFYMSSRNTLFDDTVSAGYAGDISLSRSLVIKSIFSDLTTQLEAQHLNEWALQNDMILNGKKSYEVQITRVR